MQWPYSGEARAYKAASVEQGGQSPTVCTCVCIHVNTCTHMQQIHVHTRTHTGPALGGGLGVRPARIPAVQPGPGG